MVFSGERKVSLWSKACPLEDQAESRLVWDFMCPDTRAPRFYKNLPCGGPRCIEVIAHKKSKYPALATDSQCCGFEDTDCMVCRGSLFVGRAETALHQIKKTIENSLHSSVSELI